MEITKGQIGNALTSTASDHVVAVAADIYDETKDKYQSTINDEVLTKLDNIEEGAQVNTVTGVKGNSETSYRTGNINITKDDIGLSNVDNKSSETIRSEITKTNVTTALGFTPIDSTTKGAKNGVASLDDNGKVPASLLPSYVDDVIEGYLYNGNFYSTRTETTNEETQEIDYQYSNDNKITAESGKIYIDLISSRTYRWSGSTYAEISESLALGETNSTAYPGDKGKEAYEAKHTHSNKSILDGITQLNITDWSKAQPNAENTVIDPNYEHITVTETSVSDGTNTFNKYTHPGSGTNPHGTTAKDIGLDKVTNTGDSDTPIEGGKDKFTTGGAFTLLATKVDKVEGKQLSEEDFTTTLKNKLDSIEENAEKNTLKPINTIVSTTPNTTLYTKGEVDSLLDNKINKVTGKQLSTNDFTNALKDKLESLANYNDASIRASILSIQNSLDAITGTNNTTEAIDTLNEITAFLNSYKNTDNLASILLQISNSIKNKVDIIEGKDLVENTKISSYDTHIRSISNPHNVTASQIGAYVKPSTGIPSTDLDSSTLSILNNVSDKVDKVTGSSLVEDTKVSSYDAHITNTNNPHNVTKEQLGLSNVDNTTDKNKPVSDATLLELDKKPNMINASTTSTPNTTLYTKEEVNTLLNNKVDKVIGKLLSTNDFSTALKEKLESLSNYNDSEVRTLISSLQSSLDTLSGTNDTTDIIDTMNEIITFLNTFKNNNNLSLVLSSLETTIHNWVLNRGYVSASDYNALLSRLTLMTCGGIVTGSNPVLPSRATTIVLNTSTNTISANVNEIAVLMDVETTIYKATFKVSSINGTYHLVPSNSTSLNITLDGLGTAGNTITINNPDEHLIRSVDIKA